MTVDHRPICGAAVPARRDWSLRRAIPMASNPPFFDITTGTAWLLAYRVVRHAVPGDLSAAGAAGCRSPFHCVGPGTPGRCLPYLPAVRPLPVLLDSSLFDDRNTTRRPVENLPWPLQSFVDHTAGFSAPVASASAAWGSGPQGVSEAEMVRRAASRRRTLGDGRGSGERATAWAVVDVQGQADAFTVGALHEQAVLAAMSLRQPRAVSELNRVAAGLDEHIGVSPAVRHGLGLLAHWTGEDNRGVDRGKCPTSAAKTGTQCIAAAVPLAAELP